jgi:NAD(P)-dependent dehydrogenase (short-subunit alcohol dehydrogenase family)
MFSLKEKTVVVTGGGKGIGLGIARAMARAGARVVITGRQADALQAAEPGLRADGAGDVLAIRADLTSAADMQAVVAATLARFGRIDGWVNNAGSANASDTGPLIDLAEDQWDRVVDLNLKWTFFAAQTAARAMVDGGSIVNISSRSASHANPRTGHYGAAKAAVENLTLTMAAEWGGRGIRVNAVAPGVVMTEELARTFNTPERIAHQLELVPLQRLGQPDDVGPLCAYLVSDAAAWTSGAVIAVNGGSPVPMGYVSYLRHANRGLLKTEKA